MANAAFSKDLRGSNKQSIAEPEVKKAPKREVKQRPATVKPVQKKPGKQPGKARGPKESSAGQTPRDDGNFE